MFGLKSLACMRLSSLQKIGAVSCRRGFNLIANTLIGKPVIAPGTSNILLTGFMPFNLNPRLLSISKENVEISDENSSNQGITMEIENLVVEKQWDNDFNAELDKTLVASLGSYNALQLKDTLKELEQMNVSAEQFSPELLSVLGTSVLSNLNDMLEMEQLANIIYS